KQTNGKMRESRKPCGEAPGSAAGIPDIVVHISAHSGYRPLRIVRDENAEAATVHEIAAHPEYRGAGGWQGTAHEAAPIEFVHELRLSKPEGEAVRAHHLAEAGIEEHVQMHQASSPAVQLHPAPAVLFFRLPMVEETVSHTPIIHSPSIEQHFIAHEE